MLEKKGVSPVGKHLDRIRTKTLEQALSKHPLIDRSGMLQDAERQDSVSK